jgi:hypothetical protein
MNIADGSINTVKAVPCVRDTSALTCNDRPVNREARNGNPIQLVFTYAPDILDTTAMLVIVEYAAPIGSVVPDWIPMAVLPLNHGPPESPSRLGLSTFHKLHHVLPDVYFTHPKYSVTTPDLAPADLPYPLTESPTAIPPDAVIDWYAEPFHIWFLGVPPLNMVIRISPEDGAVTLAPVVEPS